MKALVILVALGGVAHADTDWNALNRKLQGGAWLHYEATALDKVDGDGRFDQMVLAGVRLHGFIGENASVVYHAGFDLAAGGVIGGGGFAYDVALFPLGVGVRFGATSVATLGLGIGAMGATGVLDDAVTLPLELNIEAGRAKRLLARARVAWIGGAPARHDGAPDVPFADELDTTIGLRLGHAYDEYGFPTGNGYFIGASYRELAGAKFVGLTIGYSIDLAQKRRFAKPPAEHRIHSQGDLECDENGENCVRLL